MACGDCPISIVVCKIFEKKLIFLLEFGSMAVYGIVLSWSVHVYIVSGKFSVKHLKIGYDRWHSLGSRQCPCRSFILAIELVKQQSSCCF